MPSKRRLANPSRRPDGLPTDSNGGARPTDVATADGRRDRLLVAAERCGRACAQILNAQSDDGAAEAAMVLLGLLARYADHSDRWLLGTVRRRLLDRDSPLRLQADARGPVAAVADAESGLRATPVLRSGDRFVEADGVSARFDPNCPLRSVVAERLRRHYGLSLGSYLPEPGSHSSLLRWALESGADRAIVAAVMPFAVAPGTRRKIAKVQVLNGFRQELALRLLGAGCAVAAAGSPAAGGTGSGAGGPGGTSESSKKLDVILRRLVRILVDPSVRLDLLRAAGGAAVEDALRLAGQVLAHLASSSFPRDDASGPGRSAIRGVAIINKAVVSTKEMPPRRRGRRGQLSTLGRALDACASDPALLARLHSRGQSDLVARMSRVALVLRGAESRWAAEPGGRHEKTPLRPTVRRLRSVVGRGKRLLPPKAITQVVYALGLVPGDFRQVANAVEDAGKPPRSSRPSYRTHARRSPS